jgi:hypothetical protein
MELIAWQEYDNDPGFLEIKLQRYVDVNQSVKFIIVGGVGMPAVRPVPPSVKGLWLRIRDYPGLYSNNVIMNVRTRQSVATVVEAFLLGQTQRTTYPFYNVECTLSYEKRSQRVILVGSASYGYDSNLVVGFRLHGITIAPVNEIKTLVFGFKDREMWGSIAVYFIGP